MELYLPPKASFALCPALHTTTIDSSAVPVLCSMPPAPPAPASCRPPPPRLYCVSPDLPRFHLLSAAPLPLGQTQVPLGCLDSFPSSLAFVLPLHTQRCALPVTSVPQLSVFFLLTVLDDSDLPVHTAIWTRTGM